MHTFETVIRLQHTDAAGVIFFARLFDLAHLAFEDLMDRIGQPLPADLAAAEVAYPIVEASAEFHAALRLGDRVRIEARVAEIGERGFSLAYRFVRDHGALAATARTVHKAAGRGVRGPASLPEGLVTALRQLAAPGA